MKTLYDRIILDIIENYYKYGTLGSLSLPVGHLRHRDQRD